MPRLTRHCLPVKAMESVVKIVIKMPMVKIVIKMVEVGLRAKTQSHTEIAVAEPRRIGVPRTVIRQVAVTASRIGGAAAD